MTHDTVKQALQKVVDKVQTISGLPAVKLQGADIPGDVLEGFDSTIWPVATAWLAKELDVDIPTTVHIFGKTNRTLLSVDATCQLVMEKHTMKQSLSIAAE